MSDNELPEGWEWTRLDGISKIIAGQSPPGHTYRDSPEGLPFFQGKADFGVRFPIPRKWCVAPVKTALPGDILISVRAPVGPTNVADQECCIGRGLAAIRPNYSADREFVLAALKYYEPQLTAQGSGSTFKAITMEDLRSLEIPLPPLDEQRRIAAILNEQMAAVVQARAAAEAQLEASQSLMAAYLRTVFESDEMLSWDAVTLENILFRRTDIIYPRDHPVGPAVFVGLEHIEPDTGVRLGQYDIEMSELTGRKPQFYEGDIVYGYLRPYLNKVWIAEFDGLCSVDQYSFEVDEALADNEFVTWFMRSPVYMERSPVGSNTSQLPRIRLDEVLSVEINLPSLSAQRDYANVISSTVEDILETRTALQAQLDAINALPASLLRRAFSGEL